jgi:ADP-ribose pyrophosphatase YjhB (NUDIX family)
VFGYWTLTKGRIGEGEDIETLAVKKIKSEIGVDVKIITTLGENEYIANKPDIGRVIKHVRYYLAESPFIPFTLEKKGGLNDAKWFTLEEIKALRMYEDIAPLIEKGLSYIEGGKVLEKK